MPKITFTNTNQTFEVEEGSTILEAAKDHHVPIDSACGGLGACSTCHVHVLNGMENLSEMTEEEEDRLDTAEGVTLQSRLACQSRIHGDVVVEIPQV